MKVVADARRGHIALVADERGTVVIFTDLGPALQVWQYEGGVELTPDDAAALGAALTAWATKKALAEMRSVS